MEQFFPFILLALMLVVLIVLPARQRKRMQAQAAEMQASLAVGTPVMTTSGLHGTVAALGETTIDLQIAPGVVVTFTQQAILEVRKPVEPAVSPELPHEDGGPDGSPSDGTR